MYKIEKAFEGRQSKRHKGVERGQWVQKMGLGKALYEIGVEVQESLVKSFVLL